MFCASCFGPVHFPNRWFSKSAPVRRPAPSQRQPKQQPRQQTGYSLVNLDFLGFWSISLGIYFSFTRNEAQEQHSLLDTIFDYIFYFGAPGKYLYLSPQNLLHVGQRSWPTGSKLSWLFYNIFLDVQNQRYSQILYLIDYVVPGLHFW